MRDTIKEVKKRLYSYPKLDKYINDYEEELKGIQAKIQAHREVGTSSLSLTGVRGSDLSDPTVSKMLKIDALQQVYEERAKYIAEKVKKYYGEKRVIEEALDSLTEMHRQIVEERYFNKKTWEEVGELHTRRYCEKQGNEAVKCIVEFLNKKKTV